MDTALGRKSINHHNKVYSAAQIREETAEFVVPDTQPDIAEIIDTQGLVLLRSKDIEAGRAGLAGNVSATVLYMPEGAEGICKLNVIIPFSAYAESAEIRESTISVVNARILSIDARVLNPRKVLVRVEILAEMDCYEEEELALTDSITGPEGHEIHMLVSTISLSPVTSVREKTFVLNDEFQIPAMLPALDELLGHRVDLISEDVKSVGSKLVFKGSAIVNILYCAGEDRAVYNAMFTTAFSQLIEMEMLSEQPDAEIRLALTGSYIEPTSISQDGRGLNCELHLVAQAITRDRAELEYIADAYSNEYELRLERQELEAPAMSRRETIRETVRELLETPQSVREIVSLTPIIGTAGVSGNEIRVPVAVKLLYRNEFGTLCCASKSIVAEVQVELTAGAELSVADVRVTEVIATATTGGVELRIPVDIDILVSERRSLTNICVAELDEESPIDVANCPSVTVLLTGTGFDVWELAKRYRSTPELIAAANEEGTAGLILVPRCSPQRS